MKRPILFSMIVSCAGCGTLRNVATSPMFGPPLPPEKMVYGGVREDTKRITTAFGDIKQFGDAQKSLGTNAVDAASSAIDVPLSAVGDTLTLPITVPAAIDRAVADYYYPKNEVTDRKVDAPCGKAKAADDK